MERQPLADPVTIAPIEVVKVGAQSRPSAVAGAIAGILRTQPQVAVQAIGAAATNQAIKAVAIARAYLVDDQLDIACTPALIDVQIDGDERTVIQLRLERWQRAVL